MFRIGLTSAIYGLRTYPTTALLLGLALLGAISTVVPLANVFGRPDDWLGLRQTLYPISGGDLGLPWLMGVATPSAAQQEAVSILGSLLLYTMWGAVLVGLVTILSVGAARAGERKAERLIHRAVGASRRTLLMAALAEVVIIGAIPAAVGGLIGLAMTRASAATWPGNIVPGPGAATSIAAMLLLTVFTGMLVFPAIGRPRRIGEAEIHRALPTAPVVLQIAICFIVLCTGSLLASRAKELLVTHAGGANDGTIAAISVDSGKPRERSAYYQRLLEGLEPAGIRSASLSSPGTLTGLGHVAMVLTDCGRCSEAGLQLPFRLKPATHKVVSADTFRLMGLPVLDGRGIAPSDDWDAPRVAVVSRSLAAREFQNGEPIGRRIHTGDDGPEGSTVVGIVDNQFPKGLGGTLQPGYAVYVSVLQHPPRSVELLIRDRTDRGALAEAIETTLDGAGRYTVSSERAVLQNEIAPIQWFGRRFELQGWALVGLASLGIVGFMRLWVQSLTGEIGIRRSVGARRSQILRWLVWRAALVAATGVVVGVWFGVAIWSTLPTVVTGTLTWDLSRFLFYAVLSVGLVLCGVLVPAWGASRALPARLLQSSGS